jgi:DNA-binding beta-propeller fold protein YncE
MYVADTHNHRIQQFTPDGKFIRKWGGLGLGDGQFDQPRGIALDPFGNVWVADHENRRVQKFDREGRFLLKVVEAGGEFNEPRGLSSDAQGNLYVADDANNRIVKLANDGTYIRDYGGSWDNAGAGDGQYWLPYDTAVDLEGDVWVADTKNSRLVEFQPADGRVLSKWGASGGDGTPGRGLGEMDHVFTVDVDCVGNVYVSDKANHRIQKFGDPSAPPPVCPPGLTVSGTSGRGDITVDAACDRPCRAVANATVRVPGRRRLARMRAQEQLLWQAGPITLRLRLPAAVRGALRAGRRLTARLTVTAEGAPGADRNLKRSVRLR